MIRPEIRLKKDIQQCVANNMNLNGVYAGLSFEYETKKTIGLLFAFETLEISANNFAIYLDGKLNKNIINQLGKETLNKVKKEAWITQKEDIMEHIKKENQTVEEHYQEIILNLGNLEKQYIKELEQENQTEYRKCTNEDIHKLEQIKELLYKELNLNSEIVESETEVFLNIMEDKIILNKKQIKILVISLLKYLDFITIVPRITKDTLININDIREGKTKQQQVQIVLGISLEK